MTALHAQEFKYCGNTDLQNKLWEQHPELMLQQQEYDQKLHENIAASADTRDDQIYIIPIVFHIIHNYGAEAISEAQVEDAVRILNEDFRKLNPDTVDIINEFIGIAADSKIEFRLAEKTPGGGCTNGIDYIVSHETNQGDNESKLSQWPRNMYLNIWVVNSISSGAAGYAYYPSSVDGFLAPLDGIVILSDYVGSIESGNVTTSRALTHEVGHYLNLPHVWGSTNYPGVECGDDGVYDTPETQGWTTCNLNGSICTPGIIENVQNYMEYSYCYRMFTEGQGEIMRGVLNTSVSDRNNLWSASNLEATGTNDGYQASCAPHADFNPNHYFICQGADVLFQDFSWNGEVTNWYWEFPGGTPASSTEENPIVVYNESGKHTVTLTSSNSVGSGTISKDIYVSPLTAQYSHYYYEGFEDLSQFSNDWITVNVDNNDSYWNVASTAGYSGANSLVVKNYYGDKGDIDYAVTPAIDLTDMQASYLSFRYAAASSTSDLSLMDDVLRVYASTNCGETWMLRYTLTGANLINNGAWGSYFTPGSASNNWSLGEIELPASLATENVRFKFELTGGTAGNNIYIDDVLVSEYPVGIDEAVNYTANTLNIFPNPSNGDFLLTYSLPAESSVKISIVDYTGREVFSSNNDFQSTGNHQQQINMSDVRSLNSGIYMVKFQAGQESYIKKLVIE